MRLQPLLQETVRSHIGQLLQRVDLRQLVLDGELVLRIDVRNELAHRRLRGELEWLCHAGRLPRQEPVQTGLGMLAEPRFQRRNAPLVLRGEALIAQRVQQIHGLAVAVPANDNVPDVVDHAAQLQSGRLAAEVLVLEVLCMRYQIAGVTHWKGEGEHLYQALSYGAVFDFRCLPTNMSPTCISVNRVGIIRLSMHVKNTAFG